MWGGACSWACHHTFSNPKTNQKQWGMGGWEMERGACFSFFISLFKMGRGVQGVVESRALRPLHAGP